MVPGRFGSRYQQIIFRLGQAASEPMTVGAVRHFRRPLLHGLRRMVVGPSMDPRDDMRPGVMVTQKDARSDAMDLWVGAFIRDVPADPLAASIDLVAEADGVRATQRTVLLERYTYDSELATTQWSPRDGFFHAHLEIDGLEPDHVYRASVRLGADPARRELPMEASCRARTLPARLAVDESVLVLAASCYDVDTDLSGCLDRAVRRELDDVGVSPHMTFLTGDAVYLDAPWWIYGTMARHTPRSYYLQEYWSAWGMQPFGPGDPRQGLGRLLRNGPNWFLPDDHEFWNNWPHKSVTARHSWRNIRKTIGGALARSTHDARTPKGAVSPPPPREAPTAEKPRAQNFVPVHPDEWEKWSRGAFELFGSFQTRSVRDRQEGRITGGERDSDDPESPPTDVLDNGVHCPLNQIVQTIDLDPVHVVLLDTRTRRVRRHRDPERSTFVDELFLQQVLEQARAAEIFVLVLSQPVLRRPAHMGRGWLPERLDVATDRGMEDYWYQYCRFWRGLIDARAGRPTITVGGDIHRSYVGFAPSISLVEVVASPMSLVQGIEVLSRAKRRIRERLGREEVDPYHPGATLVRIGDLVQEPRGPARRLLDVVRGAQVRPSVDDDVARSLAFLPAGCAGFATLRLTRTATDRLRLDVRLHPRDDGACEPQQVGFDLYTGVSGPQSVVEVPRRAAAGRQEEVVTPMP